MINTLTQAQIKQLLGAINLNSPFGKRDYLMILFLYHTGLRVSELSALNVEHVYHNGQAKDEIYLAPGLNKNGQSRVIPLNDTARKVVLKLIEFNRSRGFKVAPGCPLWRNRRHKRLPVRCIQKLVKKHREAAGLAVPATPHTLRHSFASEALARTGSMRALQAILGHRWLNATQVYTHPTKAQLQKVVNAMVNFSEPDLAG